MPTVYIKASWRRQEFKQLERTMIDGVMGEEEV
jgi:hypothetical protein